MNRMILASIGLLSAMAAHGWDIAIENQTNNDVRCQILPRMDLGTCSTDCHLTSKMIIVPAKQNSQFQLLVWQENLNPYIVLVIMPEQKPIGWPVLLNAHSQLRFVLEGASELTLYSRADNEQWVQAKMNK